MIIRCLAIAVALSALAAAPRVESQEDSKYTILAMEYFGALDKPISQIVISNSYEGAERYRNAMMEKEPWYEWQQAHLHLLNLPRLGRLVSTVESDKDGVQQEPDLQHPYNGVSATIITPLGRNTFFFHIEPAMPLLHQLENLCKDDKSLRSDLLYFENEVRRLG